jgi:hypothetical protein
LAAGDFMNIRDLHRNFNRPLRELESTNPELTDYLKTQPQFLSWTHQKITGQAQSGLNTYDSATGNWFGTWGKLDDYLQKTAVELEQAQRITSPRFAIPVTAGFAAANFLWGATAYALHNFAGVDVVSSLGLAGAAGGLVGTAACYLDLRSRGENRDMALLGSVVMAMGGAILPLIAPFVSLSAGNYFYDEYKKVKTLAPAFKQDQAFLEKLTEQTPLEFFKENPDRFRSYLQHCVVDSYARDPERHDSAFVDIDKYYAMQESVRVMEDKFRAYESAVWRLRNEAPRLKAQGQDLDLQELEKRIWHHYWQNEISPRFETFQLSKKEMGFQPTIYERFGSTSEVQALFDHPVR